MNPNAPPVYQAISVIKRNALVNRVFTPVNLLCGVSQFLRTLSKTNRGKFTIIIQAVDPSTQNNTNLVIHFFTNEDNILKKISQGDILCLHRVKMELTPNGNDTDGRIFNSTDIIVFKQNEICTQLGSVVIPDSLKERAARLKKWMKDIFFPNLFANVTHLSQVKDSGTYKLFGKIVMEPYVYKEGLRIRVTEGSVINNLMPVFALEDGYPLLATEINVTGDQRPFTCIRANDFVLFTEVNAVKSDHLNLCIGWNNPTRFFIISKVFEQSLEIERRIKDNHVKMDEPVGTDVNVDGAMSTTNTHQPPMPPSNDVDVAIVVAATTQPPVTQQSTTNKAVSHVPRRANNLTPLPQPCPNVAADWELDESDCPKRRKLDHDSRWEMLQKLIQKNVSLYKLRKKTFTITVFTENIYPNPKGNPFLLVSGVCKDGCKRICSEFDWSSGAPPPCPSCKTSDIENPLTPMFLFELEVFDCDGRYRWLLVYGKHAEEFFGFTVQEFLCNEEVRSRCLRSVQLLTKKRFRNRRLKLSVTLVCFKKLMCVFKTKLTPPPGF